MRRAMLFFVLNMMAAVAMAQQNPPVPPQSTQKQRGPGTPAVAAKSGAAPQKKTAQAVPAGAPTREDILKLFDLLQISKTMDIALQAARQQSMEAAEQMVQERAPDATAEQKKQLREMIDEIMNQELGTAAIKEMLDATIPVYQRHLTRADVKSMVDFYSSPVGKKILREQPAMIQESMQAASGIQQRIARQMFQKIDQKMQEVLPEKGPDKQ